MNRFRLSLLALAAAPLLCTPAAFAGTIALDVVTPQAGSQDFGGTLGMDFNIGLDSVQVTHLGVFDSNQDGLANPLNAYIFDRDNPGAPVAAITFPAGATGILTNGSRFLPLGAPVTLPAGFRGSIVADGYSPSELNGNNGIIPITSTSNSGGLMRFTGGGRYGLNAGIYPANPDGGPAVRYLAGTFQFMPASPNPIYIAYDANPVAGAQNYGGSLGLDFDVGGSAVSVTHMGVFDNLQDGINGTLTAYIYDRGTALPVVGPFTFSGAGDPLYNGSRIRDIADVSLPAGFQGSVVVEGYNAAEMLFNSGGAAGESVMNGSGLINFVGSSRFGTAGSYPGTPDGGPANRYLAGTFGFQAVPEPGSAVLAVLSSAFLLRRRRAA